MSITVGLHHVTRYGYDKPISLGPQVVRLRPAPHCRTPVSELFAHGDAGAAFRELAAGSARQLARAFCFPEKTTEFSVTVDLVADLEVINPFDFFVEPDAEKLSIPISGRAARGPCGLLCNPSRPGHCAEGTDRIDFTRTAQHRRFPR